MSIKVQVEGESLLVARVRGEFQIEEFARVLGEAHRTIQAQDKIRVLVLLEDFQGWEKADWDDERINQFMWEHDGDIEKMAIVGDVRWKDQILAFVGVPYTKKMVQYFAPQDEAPARAWIE